MNSMNGYIPVYWSIKSKHRFNQNWITQLTECLRYMYTLFDRDPLEWPTGFLPKVGSSNSSLCNSLSLSNNSLIYSLNMRQYK